MAQLGYGPDGSHPSVGWTWFDATYSVDVEDKDRYVGTILTPITTPAGKYDYCYRYKLIGNGVWIYGDLDTNSNGYSPSQAGDLQIILPTPKTPTNLQAQPLSSSSIKVCWDDVFNEDYYEIERKVKGGGSFVKIGTSEKNVTCYEDKNLLESTTYLYQVRACNTAGNSPWTIPPAEATTFLVGGEYVTITTSSVNPGALSIDGIINCDLGGHSKATDGFDPGIDIPLPPRGQPPVLDSYIGGSGLFPRLKRDFRKKAAGEPFDKIWLFHAYSKDAGKFTICWDTSHLPGSLTATITQIAPTTGSSINMFSQSCFDAQFNEGDYTFKVRISEVTCESVNFPAGWSMVSIPGEPTIADVTSLVAGTSILPYIYTWDNEGGVYVLANTLEFGKSYWFAAIEDTSLSICYRPYSVLEKQLKGGWNMTGGIACSFPVSSIVSDPFNSVLSYIYTWDNKQGVYVLVDMIKPWGGYWTAAVEDAKLSMDCSWVPAAPSKQVLSAERPLSPTWEGALEIQAGSHTQQLTFGMHTWASSGFDKLLDRPVPPTPGMVDNSLKAYWSIQDKYFNNLGGSYIKENPHGSWALSIEFSEPGVIRWPNLPLSYRCLLKYDGQLMKMESNGSLPLLAGKHNLRLEIDSFESLPKQTLLLANYPNPCNPETWIPYQLSEDSEVTLIIHDVSGREIRRIHIGNQLAGRYEDKERAIYWDGKNELGEHVSSGIYFYTIKTGGYTATKKMVVSQ